DKLSYAACVQSIEAALYGRRSYSSPCPHWLRDASQVVCTKVLKLEQVAHELPGTVGNDHTVRCCNTLQARSKVRRLAYDGLLLRSTGTDQVADNDQTRRDADAGSKWRGRPEPPDGCDQLKPRSHRPFSVILMCLGITEIH